jgi:aspartate aminotransferase-like enzyme
MRDMTLERTASFAKLAADRAYASTTVSALEPVGDVEALRSKMKARGFTLGGGYGQWKERTFRIGHMGDIPLQSLSRMLDALAEVAKA